MVLAGCGKSFPYEPIPNVPKEVNELGKLIGQEQRNVVTPGGDQWKPGYSDNDRAKFEKSDKLEKIVKKVIKSDTFKKGVAALKTLPAETQAMVLKRYNTPIYPTWRMNGRIDDSGTTEAGWDVEMQIATALTDAVRDELEK